MHRGNAKDPVSGKSERQREDRAQAHNRKKQKNGSRGQKLHIGFVPTRAESALGICKGDRQAKAAVYREQQPVLAAARNCARHE
jgi:hypothetical protein